MRAHIAASPIPLREGRAYECFCGEIVDPAKFLMDVDLETEMLVPPKTFMFCRKCFAKLSRTFETKRYFYALTDDNADWRYGESA